MPLISSWKPSDPLQLLIFSNYKTGKTWGAGTFPRPVMFDYDKGAATFRNPEFVKRYGLRPIYYETFDEAKMMRGVVTQHNAFDESCRYFDEWMKPKGKWVSKVDGKMYETGRDMFDTFIIDSGTTLSDYASNKAIMVMSGMKLSHTHEQALQSGLVVPKIQDYGAERSLVEQFIDMVKNSGKNVVFICHEKIIEEGEGADRHPVEIIPLLTGKSAQSVPLKFDEVYNLRIQPQGTGIKRYLQTQPDNLRRCGTRYGMPNGLEWDYETLKKEIDKIHAEQQKQVIVTQSVGGTLPVAGAVQTTVK